MNQFERIELLENEVPGTIKCAIENAYYLDENDIKQMIEFAWQHSEYHIDRHKFSQIINEIIEDMFS